MQYTFLRHRREKNLLFPFFPNSSPHQGTFYNLLAAPGNHTYCVPWQPLVHVLCKDVSSWPPSPWESGAFVFQILYSASFSLPSWLLGRVIFSPPLPCVSILWMCSVLFTCQASVLRNAELSFKMLDKHREWCQRISGSFSRFFWLSFCSNLPKKSHIARQKIQEAL